MEGAIQTNLRQSGVLAVHEGKVMLVTSRKSSRWVIPKGMIGKGLTAAESAAKEAFEEAGVSGIVGEQMIGSYECRKMGVPCRVDVYPLVIDCLHDEWDEMHQRRRELVAPETALGMVGHKELRALIGSHFRVGIVI